MRHLTKEEKNSTDEIIPVARNEKESYFKSRKGKSSRSDTLEHQNSSLVNSRGLCSRDTILPQGLSTSLLFKGLHPHTTCEPLPEHQEVSVLAQSSWKQGGAVTGKEPYTTFEYTAKACEASHSM